MGYETERDEAFDDLEDSISDAHKKLKEAY